MGTLKTDIIKQLIVRYIRDTNMHKGDALPSQDFFRRFFKCGMTTVSAAINDLKNDGVLQVYDKVGVFVIDPNVDGHAGRVIGITAKYVEGSPYYSSLLGALQMNLIRKGCQTQIFCCNDKNKNSFSFSIDDFSGLRRCIKSNELDAVMHLDDFKSSMFNLLEKKKIPVFFVGNIGISPDGLFYDQQSMLHDMCLKLREIGAKRPGLYIQSPIKKYLEGIFIEETNSKGIIYSDNSTSGCESVARELIAMNDAERPDAMIYMDDIHAQQIICILVQHLPYDKIPRSIILRNRQLMLSYPVSDPIFYSIDLVEVATKAVELLLNTLKNENLHAGHNFYALQEDIENMSIKMNDKI
ncbi:MAG: GntR family transcriptional regulator [Lentisphaeria bacterium]